MSAATDTLWRYTDATTNQALTVPQIITHLRTTYGNGDSVGLCLINIEFRLEQHRPDMAQRIATAYLHPSIRITGEAA